jgi:hypothetical protein
VVVGTCVIYGILYKGTLVEEDGHFPSGATTFEEGIRDSKVGCLDLGACNHLTHSLRSSA